MHQHLFAAAKASRKPDLRMPQDAQETVRVRDHSTLRSQQIRFQKDYSCSPAEWIFNGTETTFEPLDSYFLGVLKRVIKCF